ncbi:MAG: hypothetical protein ABF449_13790, partial [Ethanoligenens sp.]
PLFSPSKKSRIFSHWLSVKSLEYPILHLQDIPIDYIGSFGRLLSTGSYMLWAIKYISMWVHFGDGLFGAHEIYSAPRQRSNG